MTSEKQLAANRRNAQRSTGPTTPEGKRRVSRNALKHGLCAEDAFILDGDGQEDMQPFLDLCDRLVEELSPATVLDEMDVQRIALATLQLSRVQKRETGLRRQALDAIEFKRMARQRAMVQRAIRTVEYGPPSDTDSPSRCVPLDEAEWSLLFQTSPGLAYVCTTLEALRQDVGAGYELSADTRRQLEVLFGRQRGSVADWCAGYHARWLAAEEHRNGDLPDDSGFADYKTQLLAAVGRELERLRAEQEEVCGVQELDGASDRARLALPTGDDYELLLRYETHYTRQIRKAEAALETRRRQRVAAAHAAEDSAS